MSVTNINGNLKGILNVAKYKSAMRKDRRKTSVIKPAKKGIGGQLNRRTELQREAAESMFLATKNKRRRKLKGRVRQMCGTRFKGMGGVNQIREKKTGKGEKRDRGGLNC